MDQEVSKRHCRDSVANCSMGEIIEYRMRDTQVVHRVPLHQGLKFRSRNMPPGTLGIRIRGALRDFCPLHLVCQSSRCIPVASFGPSLAYSGIAIAMVRT